MTPSAFLDWNATAPLRPVARAAMAAALEQPGNPSSVHGFGRAARRQVEAARDEVRRLVGAPAGAQVVFTSGATEANALALRGVPRPMLATAVEHASVLAARADVAALPVDGGGRVDLDALDRRLAALGAPALVSVMAANNETGVLQPVAEAAAVVHRHGGFLHCDAVQIAGRLPFDMAAAGVDLASLSSHKIGGPQGVGALVAAPHVELHALVRGGGQESGLRAGTENVAGIAGFAAACAAAREDRAAWASDVAVRRDRLEREARRRVPASVVIAADVPRLPNTAAIALPGHEAATIVMALDLAGVAVSAGAACSSGKVQASHVLAAMDLPAAIRQGTVRVSIGPSTTEAEIDLFVEAWSRVAARLDANRRAAA